MVSSSEQLPDPDSRPVSSGEFQRSLDQVNKRIDDLRSDLNQRIDDLRSEMKTGQAWMRWGIGLMLALTLALMGLVLSGVG